MNLKREVIEIILGAVFLSLFLSMGWLKPANTLWDNIIISVVLLMLTRLIAFLFAGRKR